MKIQFSLLLLTWVWNSSSHYQTQPRADSFGGRMMKK